MKSYVLDTSVIVEKIIRNSPYREKVEQLFSAQRSGTVKLFVAIPTLSETLYIASRIYQLAGVNNANEEALNYISWLKTKITPVNIDEETAIVAGELKKQLGLALADCYVIAVAQKIGGLALFLKSESEMMAKEQLINKLPVRFLSEETL
ncbi:MAG: PIN domain-containing protein [Thermofilum sp.]|nr:PIN domain-containing protein [Thermofilum sp.]